MTCNTQENSKFWRHPSFRDLGLLKAKFTKHRYERHTHPTYVIALITEGCERVTIGQQRVTASAGSIIVVNPEQWHDGEAGAEDGWRYSTLYPRIELMRAIADDLGQGDVPVFGHPIIHDPRLARSVELAHRSSESDDAIAAETTMLIALRQLILGYSGENHRTEAMELSGAHYRFSIYEQVIEDDLISDIGLQRLADAAHVNRFQVIRDFKKVAGLTPAKFIRDRRVRRANSLIEAGSSLAEAAIDAGFADQSHLSRTFRAAYGITPGMFKPV